MLPDCLQGLYYRIVLWDYVAELHHGIILRNHITERYYLIISRNHPYEKDPGDAQDVPRAPSDQRYPAGTPLGPWGTPLGPLGDVPETPQGRPWDPWGTSRGPRTTKAAISEQIYSARISRLLCSNLIVGTHRMKHSARLFCL